ncbi:hypothetical protein ACP70R_001158 [Stipagrostis hirtigluma subsp. patula]
MEPMSQQENKVQEESCVYTLQGEKLGNILDKEIRKFQVYLILKLLP